MKNSLNWISNIILGINETKIKEDQKSVKGKENLMEKEFWMWKNKLLESETILPYIYK